MCKANIAKLLLTVYTTIVASFILLPAQSFIFVIAVIGVEYAYETILRGTFLTHSAWRLAVDIRRIVEFLFTALGIHIIYTLIYSLVSLLIKKKTEFFLLAILVFNVLFSMIVLDFRRPRGGGFIVLPFSDYRMAYAFLFAMIMFAVFTFIMHLLRKNTKWGKWKIVLSSFLVSTFLGSAISSVVWVILFVIFHGFTVTSV